MHGLGNDFIVIDNLNGKINLSSKQVAGLCDRHTGIGADGVILVEPSSRVKSNQNANADTDEKKDELDCFMNYYNKDGSEAEMCGNGIRCVAKFLRDDCKKDKKTFKIDTRAAVKEVIWEGKNIFSVNMGRAVFSHNDFPDQSQKIDGLSFDFVSVGNPHAVSLVEDLTQHDLKTVGPRVENDESFPNKINVELIQKIKSGEYSVKVWERGCGETLACGTGACAVYAVVKKSKNEAGEITVILPGGKLYLSENKDGEIIMAGEAESVFSGMVSV